MQIRYVLTYSIEGPPVDQETGERDFDRMKYDCEIRPSLRSALLLAGKLRKNCWSNWVELEEQQLDENRIWDIVRTTYIEHDTPLSAKTLEWRKIDNWE